MKEKIIGFLIALLALVVLLALSWALTCVITWLICLCFHLNFNLATSTGIWLVLMLLGSFFRGNSGRSGSK